jgi:hypothetical protein
MKFSLGIVVATPAALAAMEQEGVNPLMLLAKHSQGDWGDLDVSDLKANDEALVDGTRIFSSYKIGTTKFWVITEADRSSTTILLPDEY